MTKDEMIEIVDRNGNVLGLAARSEFHGNPSLIHRVVHVLVFDTHGRLLLQEKVSRQRRCARQMGHFRRWSR